MINLDPMIVPESIGRILSPTIKLIVMASLLFLLIKAYGKFKAKRTKLAKILLIAIFFFFLAPLFSAFDILLGWQDIPFPNTFLGMGFAFFFSALGNVAYFAFLIEIYGQSTDVKEKSIRLFYGVSLLEILSTLMALVLKILQSKTGAFISIAIHMLLSLFIYGYNVENSRKIRKYAEKEYKNRFTYMIYSGYSMILMMVFFVIDSFYIEFTIWSYLGWGILIISVIYLYKAYLEI